MKQILLFPFNGNCREAISVIDAINRVSQQWHILGFIDDDKQKSNIKSGPYSVLGDRSLFAQYPEAFVLACPGRPDNFLARLSIVQSLNIPTERFATIVHPSASIGSDCSIGPNSLIMANVVLTANVKIGSHVIILPNSVIAHDSIVSDWTMIGSNVSVSGGVSIGRNCYIGTGSKIINDIAIGDRTMVGIGSVVLRHTASSVIIAGNPARNLHEN